MHKPGVMKCSIIESDLWLAHCEAILLYPGIPTLTLSQFHVDVIFESSK